MASMELMDYDTFKKINQSNQNGKLYDFDFDYGLITNPGFSGADLTVDTPDEIEHNPWKEHVEMFIPTFVKQKEIKITINDSISSYNSSTDIRNEVKNVYVNDKFVGTLSNVNSEYYFNLIIGPDNLIRIKSYSEETIKMKMKILLQELSAIFS